jgi:L-fuculose-phosphate aldolase
MLHEDMRSRVAELGRRLERDGLLSGTAGNISARVGPKAVAITPSAMPYGEIEAADVVVTDLEGTTLDGSRRPSSELPFHLAVYRARDDVGGVVHTHSPFATALAIVHRPIPAVHYGIASFGVDEIPVVPYETFGSRELAARLESVVRTGANGALLANHGAIALGTTIDEAAALASLLEFIAAAYHRALLVGDPIVLPGEELARVRGRLRTHGQPDRR